MVVLTDITENLHLESHGSALHKDTVRTPQPAGVSALLIGALEI